MIFPKASSHMGQIHGCQLFIAGFQLAWSNLSLLNFTTSDPSLYIKLFLNNRFNLSKNKSALIAVVLKVIIKIVLLLIIWVIIATCLRAQRVWVISRGAGQFWSRWMRRHFYYLIKGQSWDSCHPLQMVMEISSGYLQKSPHGNFPWHSCCFWK